jgi:hypothetical protein
MSKTDVLIKRLEVAGFAGDFIRTCLPDWWDEQAEGSDSSWTHLQLGLAQRLSIDPLSLFDENAPLQLSDVGRPKFKHLVLSEAQQRAANGFGSGLARLLFAATPGATHELPASALELRHLLLEDALEPWVGFGQLLTLCFAFGIPVAHLTAFPAGIKGMAAMATSVGQRGAIFTARKPTHPAQVAFYIAHELGHLALGHVRDGRSIVEALTLDPNETDDGLPPDDEETAADRFAFELLTGQPVLQVQGRSDRGTAKELVDKAVRTGHALRIDPGLIILCFGRATKRWPLGGAALKMLPDHDVAVTAQINRALRTQLDPEMLSSEDRAYLDAVVAV